MIRKWALSAAGAGHGVHYDDKRIHFKRFCFVAWTNTERVVSSLRAERKRNVWLQRVCKISHSKKRANCDITHACAFNSSSSPKHPARRPVSKQFKQQCPRLIGHNWARLVTWHWVSQFWLNLVGGLVSQPPSSLHWTRWVTKSMAQNLPNKLCLI